MSRTLPPRPRLERLKREARQLRQAQRAGDRRACERLRTHHPRYGHLDDDAIAAEELPLRSAQQVIAKEYGFDADRIFLSGYSAGGHMAALIATDPPQQPSTAVEG